MSRMWLERALLEGRRAVRTAGLPLHGRAGEQVWRGGGMVCRSHWVEVKGLLGRLGVEELRIQSGGVQEGLVWLRSREQRFVKASVEASRVVQAAELEEAVAALLIEGCS